MVVPLAWMAFPKISKIARNNFSVLAEEMVAALVLSIVLTFGIVQIPGINDVFRLTSLNGLQWFQVFLLSAAIVPVVELVKYIQGRKSRV
jgi:hypothetical protein